MDKIIRGDALEGLRTLEDNTVQTVVTSPPYYGLRDYGVDGQIGLEECLEEYIEKIVTIFREVRRVLRSDGTLWLNLGDTYSAGGRGNARPLQQFNRGTLHGAWKVRGLGPKQLLGVPWRIALALQADGWILRQDIIWHKPNPMAESVSDRCTKAHEYLFLLAKSPRYLYDRESIREAPKPSNNGRLRFAQNSKRRLDNAAAYSDQVEVQYAVVKGANRRSVWTIAPRPFKGGHFATFPSTLAEPCIRAGSNQGDLVLDPFIGAGTTAVVAKQLGRHYVGMELNPAYIKLAQQRIAQVVSVA